MTSQFLNITHYSAHYLYELQAINTHHVTRWNQDDGQLFRKTVNDLISGRTNGVFMYLLLRKTISSKWLAEKSLHFFHIFALARLGGLGPAGPLWIRLRVHRQRTLCASARSRKLSHKMRQSNVQITFREMTTPCHCRGVLLCCGFFHGFVKNIYCVSKKQYTSLLIITLANVDRFSNFFHCQNPKETIYVTYRVFHLILTVLLHYLAKFKIENNGWTFTHK